MRLPRSITLAKLLTSKKDGMIINLEEIRPLSYFMKNGNLPTTRRTLAEDLLAEERGNGRDIEHDLLQ